MPFQSNPKIKHTQLFINNEWVNSASGKTFVTENPATEQPICHVQEGDKIDVDKAVAAAKAAFSFESAWRKMDASQRGRLLFKLADLIEEEADYIASVDALDNGKTAQSARGDVDFTLDFVRYYAGYADKLHGLTLPADGDCFSMTRLEPVGVVGAICPWNYPFQLAVTKLAPCLAAGCTIVIKPAEQTPLSALIIGDLCVRAGFPPGVVNIVPGFGETAGAALVKHPDVAKVTFTGSTEVGRLIMCGAGASNLKRVSLELGGKSPLIICNDCPDLDEACRTAHDMSVAANHGQCCVAATRTFVQDGIYDAFVAKSKALAEKIVVGDPFDEKTVQGPQIDKVQTDKIIELIDSGVSQGARLVTGGKRIACKGYFVEPTVFADVRDNMRIAREEIFGPVQSILRFHTLDEAIDRANDSHYGLGAGIFSSNIQTALYAAQRLQAGSVWINTYLHMSPHTPFGGYKESGHEREFGLYGIEPYLERKTITIALKNKIS